MAKRGSWPSLCYRPGGKKLDPGNAPEDASDESQPFDTPMFPKFPGEGDLPAED
ncbi:MAG: hypothetical protein OSB61_13755 [Verrucomicrobiota bacterium]|nr:hypothetical protein [Verrucomicrobiota bacterium]